MRWIPVVLCSLVASVASAGTLRVPQDFPTIQAAVDAASSGDTVRIGKGRFLENVTVPGGKDNLTIRGSGKGTIVDGRPFGAVGSGPAFEVTANGFRLENLTARFALGFTPSVIRITGDDAVVRRVRVDGAVDQGLVVVGHRARVERCASRGGDVGIVVAGNDATIRDCVVANVLEIGIGASGSQARIRGCRVTNAVESAIVVMGFGAVVEKNRVSGSGDDAIIISTDHVKATGNVVQSSAGDHGGIVVDMATSGVIAKNVMTDCDGPAVTVFATASGLEIVGNRASRCGREAVATFVIDGTDNVLVGNRVTDAAGDGISVNALHNVLTKNTVLRSALDGFEIGASATLVNNVARDNHAEGISIVVLGVSLTGNKAQKNRTDIASTFALDAFAGNQFGTGGEGVAPEIDD